MYRKTYLEINENNLKTNIENIKENYPDYDYYFGVVKGNAYGHGMHIVNALIDGGINYLAVSSLEEALSVRKYNKKIPVLCFGYIDINDLDIAIKNNITITITSFSYFKELLKKDLKGLRVHIKLNTGMNRFGLKNKKEVKEIVDTLKDSDIYLEGIYTHYATSGVFDTYWDIQTKRFEELTSLINLKEIPIVHAYDSLSLVKHPKKDYFNGVRLGIVMYGYSSSSKELNRFESLIFDIKKWVKLKGKKVSPTILSNNLKLKKAFTLCSEVVSITEIEALETVGYHGEYVADTENIIATIPIGYADGITKFYKKVKINNHIYPIVAFCMDALMVSVDDSVEIGDKVILLDDSITVSSVASASGMTVNQVLVSISNRVSRVHIYNEEKEEIKY